MNGFVRSRFRDRPRGMRATPHPEPPAPERPIFVLATDDMWVAGLWPGCIIVPPERLCPGASERAAGVAAPMSSFALSSTVSVMHCEAN